MNLTLHDRERLRRLLDLSDRLGRLRRRLREGSSAPTTGEVSEEVREIAGSIAAIGLPGVLGRLAADHHLSPPEVLVLLLLLNRRIEGGSNPLSGREILTLLFPTAFGVLSGAALLTPDGALRVCGAVVAEDADAEDALEAKFRLGDDLFRAIEQDASPRPERDRKSRPYGSPYEHLADLGRVVGLLHRRANALFEVDPFGHHAFEEAESPAFLQRRAAALLERVRERLARTEGAGEYPLVRLCRRHRLSEDEALVLVALLLQECYYGAPGLEAVELTRMVSRSEEDLLRKRALFEPAGTLRREGLVEVVESPDERDPTPELTLSRAACGALLGGAEGKGADPIDADLRLEFHEYLKHLSDSDRFFRDLGR